MLPGGAGRSSWTGNGIAGSPPAIRCREGRSEGLGSDLYLAPASGGGQRGSGL